MISFTISEIILSVASATIYGTAFAFFIDFLSSCRAFFRYVLFLPVALFFYKGSIIKSDIRPRDLRESENDKKRPEKINKILSALYRTLVIFAFFLGFVLLTYLTLDGEIRFYMLAACLLSCALAKRTVVSLAFKVISRVVFCVYYALIICGRVAFFLPRTVAILLWRLFLYVEGKIYKKLPAKPILSLDTHIIK